MTFGELRFDLSKLFPGLDPDLLDSFINKRYQRILEHLKWKDTEAEATLTTVIDEPNYAAPADFRLPMEGRDVVGDREIVFISRTDLNAWAPGRAQTGTPQVYTLVDATTIEVYPVPTEVADFTFRYIKRIARFTASDTSVELLPWVSIECLQTGVEADVCKHEKDYAGYDRDEAKFQREMTKMGVTDAHRTGPARVKISPIHARRTVTTIRRQL